jgi:hypothetical protein
MVFREIFFGNGEKLAVDSNKLTDFLKILLSSCCKSCRVRLKGSETTKHLQHVDHVTFNLTEENLCIYWFFTKSRNSKSLFPNNFDRIVSEFEDNHRCALDQHFTRLSVPASLISLVLRSRCTSAGHSVSTLSRQVWSCRVVKPGKYEIQTGSSSVVMCQRVVNKVSLLRKTCGGTWTILFKELYTDDLVHLNGRQVFVFRTTTGKFILSTTSLNLFGVILSMIVLSDDQSACSFVFCRIDSQRMYQSWNLGTVTRTPG